MSTRGQKGRGRGRPPERDIPKFYLVACELADDQPLTRAVRKVVQRVEPSPTYFDVNVRRIRRKFKKQRAEEWLTTIAKKYGWIDDYDPACFADASLATPDPAKEGALQFSQARVMQDSPEWFDMARNGWHPVQGLGGGAWIIERYLQCVLTPVEHEAECAAYFEQIAQLGPIEIDGSLQEDGVLPPDSQ